MLGKTGRELIVNEVEWWLHRGFIILSFTLLYTLKIFPKFFFFLST